jgi:hypothetical protein
MGGEGMVNFLVYFPILWARGSIVLKVLCYKPEGHCFETDEGITFF